MDNCHIRIHSAIMKTCTFVVVFDDVLSQSTSSETWHTIFWQASCMSVVGGSCPPHTLGHITRRTGNRQRWLCNLGCHRTIRSVSRSGFVTSRALSSCSLTRTRSTNLPREPLTSLGDGCTIHLTLARQTNWPPQYNSLEDDIGMKSV